jgi:hypothetical protein
MKKTLLLMILSLLMSALAPAQTPAQSQQIRRMLDSAEQKLRNSGIDREFTPTTIAREEEAIEEGKAIARYMLRVCADKRAGRALLKQADADQKALDHEIAESRRPANVIVINPTPSIPYIPYTAPTYSPSTRYFLNRPIGRFEPDGTGGGTFYGE